MALEISGKVIQVLPLQSGQGKVNEWRKQDFILETQTQYPKKVCISLWGDRIDQARIIEGDVITASFDVESREYNGRWYTDLRAWKVVKGEAGAEAAVSGNSEGGTIASGSTPVPAQPDWNNNEGADDLPF